MIKKQFTPLVIEVLETDTFPLPNHSQNYNELVYIFKGSGVHFINHLELPYKAGDLFLISSEDQHYFEFKKSTKFCLIKFNESFFEYNKHLAPDAFISPLQIMHNVQLKETKLVFTEPCKTILRRTIDNIVDYNCKTDIANSPIMFYQILALFGLIREASAKVNIQLSNGIPQKDDLIAYIHQNIYHPEKIRVTQIARHFNIAHNYFSAYFNRNFDTPYRNYINDYKMNLIERRVQSGQMTLKQIAFEFGFTDESHLTHFFKKNKKMTPSEFRELISN